MKKIIPVLVIIFSLCKIDLFAQEDKFYLAFSAAAFDVLQKDKTSLEGRIEYRFYKKDWIVNPFSGVMYNIHNAFHFYFGFLLDIPLSDKITLTPSFAPGLYYEGESKRLGLSIQFRSQLELSFKMEDESKFGISFNHISNASLADSNPGVESFALTYIVPFEMIFN
ncbi:acyloxyacyl hydrolase [Bacteroidota bacterium]